MKLYEFYFLEMQDDGSEDCIDILIPVDYPEEFPFRTDAFWNRYACKRAANYRMSGRKVRAIRIDTGEIEEKSTVH